MAIIHVHRKAIVAFDKRISFEYQVALLLTFLLWNQEVPLDAELSQMT